MTWTYSQEMLKSGQNWHFVVSHDHKVGQMTLKTIGDFSYAFSSLMYHFLVTSELKFELQSGNAQIDLFHKIFPLADSNPNSLN